MDINTIRGLSTVLVMIAFFGVCWWAFSPRRRKRFDDAANLPFADDPAAKETDSASDVKEPAAAETDAQQQNKQD